MLNGGLNDTKREAREAELPLCIEVCGYTINRLLD